jgi:hypothetical protein
MHPQEPFRAPSLAALPGVLHAFSTALRTPEDHAAFAAAAGLAGLPPPLRLRQVHGAVVVRAEGAEAGAEGDAWVATTRGLTLAIATADCVPVLLADPTAGVIAAVHAGWRGMRARILARALESMLALGARAGRIHAGIGPSVKGGCYEVGAEVRAEFGAAFPLARTLFEGRRLDLVAAARLELETAGVPPSAVSVVDRCTHCASELASHRREGQARGTNLSVIALAG